MPKKLLNSPAFLITCVAAIAAAALMSPKTQSLVEAAADFTSPRSIPQSEQWTVTKVSDGDSITVRQTTGQEMKVRLCGIDANESKQAGGQEAKVYLKTLLEKSDNTVMVSPVTTDRYQRTVAEVFIAVGNDQELFIQEEMLKAGMARAYPQYISSCPNKDAILKAQEIGKQNRAGVWANPNSIPPWEWRKQHRRN